MKIALTGATGYLGKHLVAQLSEAGHEISALPFRLEGPLPAELLAGYDALIHAAWDFFAEDDRNVSGSSRLLKQAQAEGVAHILFISSLSAFPGCRSNYGATKMAVEAANGGTNVRLGFVFEESTRGLSGALRKLGRLPVIPLPGGGSQKLYTIHAREVGNAILKLLQTGPGTFDLAYPEAVTLKGLLLAFAAQQGNKPLFLPVPWRALWMGLRTLETVGLKLRFRSDSLVSLMHQNPAPDFAWLRKAGIRLSKC